MSTAQQAAWPKSNFATFLLPSPFAAATSTPTPSSAHTDFPQHPDTSPSTQQPWPQPCPQSSDHPSSDHPFLSHSICRQVEAGELGSPPGEAMLKALKPSYWFSAHLHTKFAAVVQHDTPAAAASPAAPTLTASTAPGSSTRFLALDKCLPGREFLQV